MEDTSIVWLPESDLILFVDEADDIEGPGIVTGRVLPNKIILDLNRVDYPVSLEYFQKLWNSLYPEQMLAPDQIVIEKDGEHRHLSRKVAMPAGFPSQWKLKDIGNLGENLIPLIPGISNVESVKGNGETDVDVAFDFNGVRYAAEVKTNSRNTVDPYRYRITGKGVHSLERMRQFKTDYATQLGLTPATLGITIDYDNGTFDACLMPGKIATFLGGPNTVIAQDIPFENTNKVKPLNAPRNMDSRVPAPFTRPGETSQPSWKKQVKTPVAPVNQYPDQDLDQIFGSVKKSVRIPAEWPELLRNLVEEVEFQLEQNDRAEWKRQKFSIIEDAVRLYTKDQPLEVIKDWVVRLWPEAGPYVYEESKYITMVSAITSWLKQNQPEEVVENNYDTFRDPNAFGDTREDIKERWEVGEKDERGRLKWANILDPIHDELDQRVFDGIEPRMNLLEGHLNHIREVFRQNGFDHRAFSFFLTGSICTYQYSETSDCDITVVCTAEEFSDEDRADLVQVVVRSLDGKKFPGTNYPFQHFVQPVGVDVYDLFKTGLRSAYDFQTNEWVIPPNKSRAVDIQNTYPDWFAEAIQVSEKMNTMIDAGMYEDAYQYYKVIHKRRQEDQRASGDISSGNVIYKFVINNGTIDRLRNVGYKIPT